jgi:hypothetical protein
MIKRIRSIETYAFTVYRSHQEAGYALEVMLWIGP